MKRKVLNSKTLLAMTLSAAMVAGSLTGVSAAEASSFPDMPNDWSTAALTKAVENGLLSGMDGSLNPQGNLTRAQMAVIITKAFGSSSSADLSSFTDVAQGEWYYDSLSKAVFMGAFAGADGKLNPNANITREEAFAVLARVFKLPAGSDAALSSFSDASDVADWAKSGVSSLVSEGYVSGANGKINPKAGITRAEFAQIMYGLVDKYITNAGESSESSDANIMINTPGVSLKGATVSGDIIIGDGVGDGDVTLDNVTLAGRLVVRGGGSNSIHLVNTKIPVIILDNKSTDTRIAADENSSVESVQSETNAILDGKGTFTAATVTSGSLQVKGEAGTVTVNEGAAVVVDKEAKVETLSLAGAGAGATISGEVAAVEAAEAASGAEITVEKGAKVDSITTAAPETKMDITGEVKSIETAETAANSTVTANAGASISNVKANADGVKVAGDGKVDKVSASANDVAVETKGTTVSASSDATGVTAGGESVSGGKTTTTSGTGSGGGGGGSSSGGSGSGGSSSSDNGDSNKKVAAITALTVGEAKENKIPVTATVSNAKNGAKVKFELSVSGSTTVLESYEVEVKDNKAVLEIPTSGNAAPAENEYVVKATLDKSTKTSSVFDIGEVVKVGKVTVTTDPADVTTMLIGKKIVATAALTAVTKEDKTVTNKNITWSSSNPAVASVTPQTGDGNELKADIKALSLGTTVIKATAANGVESEGITLTVNPVIKNITTSENPAGGGIDYQTLKIAFEPGLTLGEHDELNYVMELSAGGKVIWRTKGDKNSDPLGTVWHYRDGFVGNDAEREKGVVSKDTLASEAFLKNDNIIPAGTEITATVSVAISGDSNLYKDSIKFTYDENTVKMASKYTDAEKATALKAVNAATTAETMKKALEDNAGALGLDMTSGYTKMFAEDQTKVAALLAGKTYDTAAAFAEAFEKVTAEVNLENLKVEAEKALAALQKYTETSYAVTVNDYLTVKGLYDAAVKACTAYTEAGGKEGLLDGYGKLSTVEAKLKVYEEAEKVLQELRAESEKYPSSVTIPNTVAAEGTVTGESGYFGPLEGNDASKDVKVTYTAVGDESLLKLKDDGIILVKQLPSNAAKNTTTVTMTFTSTTNAKLKTEKTVDVTIEKMTKRNAPTGLKAVLPTQADGKGAIAGVTTEMQYATKANAALDKYTAIEKPEALSEQKTPETFDFPVDPGTYYVRYKADTAQGLEESEPVVIEVEAYQPHITEAAVLGPEVIAAEINGKTISVPKEAVLYYLAPPEVKEVSDDAITNAIKEIVTEEGNYFLLGTTIIGAGEKVSIEAADKDVKVIKLSGDEVRYVIGRKVDASTAKSFKFTIDYNGDKKTVDTYTVDYSKATLQSDRVDAPVFAEGETSKFLTTLKQNAISFKLKEEEPAPTARGEEPVPTYQVYASADAAKPLEDYTVTLSEDGSVLELKATKEGAVIAAGNYFISVKYEGIPQKESDRTMVTVKEMPHITGMKTYVSTEEVIFESAVKLDINLISIEKPSLDADGNLVHGKIVLTGNIPYLTAEQVKKLNMGFPEEAGLFFGAKVQLSDNVKDIMTLITKNGDGQNQYTPPTKNWMDGKDFFYFIFKAGDGSAYPEKTSTTLTFKFTEDKGGAVQASEDADAVIYDIDYSGANFFDKDGNKLAPKAEDVQKENTKKEEVNAGDQVTEPSDPETPVNGEGGAEVPSAGGESSDPAGGGEGSDPAAGGAESGGADSGATE